MLFREKLRKRALRILRENVYKTGKDRGYTAASGRVVLSDSPKLRFLYPFQWLWDTFFIAAWTENVNQGITDVKKFFKSQKADGFLGHIRYNRDILKNNEYFPPPNIYFKNGVLPKNGEVTSKITQPPNAAWGVWEIFKKIKNRKKARRFLRWAYPKLFLYHKYIYDKLTEDSFFVTIHPWQNGDDNSPKWDEIFKKMESSINVRQKVYEWLAELKVPYERADLKLIAENQRPINSHYDAYLFLIYLYGKWNWNEKVILEKSPFKIASPLTTSILLRSNQALLQISEELGIKKDRETIWNWIVTSEKALNKLWDKRAGLFYPKNLVTGKLIKITSFASFIPLFSRSISNEKAHILKDNLEKIMLKYKKTYFIPSILPDEKKYFDPLRYWRGPTWIIMNILITEGLDFYGFMKTAHKIRKKNYLLLKKSDRGNGNDFYEYFHPLTGEGLGSPRQSWTAAAVLKLLLG